jgi:IS30 family transposase
MNFGLKEKIIELRKQKLTYNQIAEKLNCAKSTISYHCQNEGMDDIGLKLVAIDKSVAKQIKSFTRKNSLNAAAKHFGLSKTTIVKYKHS